jgi:hypothetical protein
VRALPPHTCTPPHFAGVRALPSHTCAPPLIAGVRALPRWRVRPPTAVRAPLLAGVRALIHRRARPPPRWHACPNPQTCAPPSSLACAPYPAGGCAPRKCARPLLAGVRALPTPVRGPSQTCAPCPQLCAPCPPNVRAVIDGGKTRYIRRGPSHPHFTTLGFVSWDSFVGSLHEVVGMVQHFRFLPF